MGISWTEEEYQDYMKKKENKIVKDKKPKKSKYKNKRTWIDGVYFDSKKEAKYYNRLKLLKKEGFVREIELQPKFLLQEKFKKGGKNYREINYIADFKVTYKSGKVEVIDVKGIETQVFKIKKKLFEYKYSDLSLKIVK